MRVTISLAQKQIQYSLKGQRNSEYYAIDRDCTLKVLNGILLAGDMGTLLSLLT